MAFSSNTGLPAFVYVGGNPTNSYDLIGLFSRDELCEIFYLAKADNPSLVVYQWEDIFARDDLGPLFPEDGSNTVFGRFSGGVISYNSEIFEATTYRDARRFYETIIHEFIHLREGHYFGSSVEQEQQVRDEARAHANVADLSRLSFSNSLIENQY